MSDTAVESKADHIPPPTQKQAAGLIAGAAILAMSALSGFGIFVAVEGLVTPGDAAATVADIAASDGLFRWGTLSMYGVVVLDVVVAWALFRFFSPVNRGLSQLAAWLRLAYAAVFMVAIAQLAGIPDLVTSNEYSEVFTKDQIQGQTLLKIDAFDDLWMAGLILFGFHLAVVGYLAYVSGYVPRWLGVLLVIAGIGYVLDSVASTVLASPPGAVATVTFVGEFLLAIWLVARSRNTSPKADGHGL